MGYDDIIEKGNISIDELMKDHRKKLSPPEGIVPGTPEYYRWWVENNKERQKLYQKRHYLKKRMIQKAMSQRDISTLTAADVKTALQEVENRIALLNTMPDDVRVKKEEGEEPPDEQIPFVLEEAQRHNISYEEALEVMEAEDYDGPEAFERYLAKKSATNSGE